MAAQESGSRPGYFIMRWSWYWSLLFAAGILGFAVYLVIELVTGGIPQSSLSGALVGTALFFALGAFLLIRSLRTSMTDSAQLHASGLFVSTSRWSGEISPDEIERVRQVRSNPYNAREIPIRSWRHWIRFDLVSGKRGFRTLYVWQETPVEFLEALQQRGFAVQGKVRLP